MQYAKQPSSLLKSYRAALGPTGFPETLDEKRLRYRLYYDQQISYIREYFKLKGFPVADIILDVLLERKGTKLRKDDYTPDYGHEIDQLLARISAIEAGIENGTINLEEIEAEHGSIESMFIAVLVHDLGEDFGLMPQDLEDLIHSRLVRRSDIKPQAHFETIISRAGQSMERLTHDRHYTIAEFQKQFGQNLEIPIPQGDEKRSLNDDIKDMLWEQMDVLPDHGRENFQAFVRIHPKTGQPRITVTRYSRGTEWGAEWNLYMNVVMRMAYEALVKFGDSANGMTSRLSIKEFTAFGYSRYLGKRVQLHDLNDATWRMAAAFEELAKDFESVGGMMGVAYIFGSIFVNHHPDFNKNGESGYSAQNLPLDEDGIIHINPHDFFERALQSYVYTPGLSHPIARFMQQYKDVVELHKGGPWEEDVTYLYEQTRACLIKHFTARNDLGLNIQELIDNPENVNPMPQLLERLRRGHPNPDPKTDLVPVGYA